MLYFDDHLVRVLFLLFSFLKLIAKSDSLVDKRLNFLFIDHRFKT